MFNGILILWFILTILSVIYTAYSLANTPVSWVQKLGWLLVVFYTGAVGLFFYMLTCRSPGKGMHTEYTKAHWKQAVNSEVHCLAGDATGIIIAAIILSFFTLNNGSELILEYVTAFICGLLIFQAGMMLPMYKNYYTAVKKTFFAELTSMNMVMLGMVPVMVIMMDHINHARNPAHLAFWFTMGIATIVGGLTAYPINSWLVKHKLKHGCMTIGEHIQHEEHQHKTPQQTNSEHHHDMKTLSNKQQWLVIGVTFLLFFAAIFVTAFFVTIQL